jgi:shikimate dehydrogenase
MIRLALVGKNIHHSKSPQVYKELLGPWLHYDLLDFADSKDIPSALELLSVYQGVSITSPYKKHFLPEIQLSETASLLGAVNCLGIKNGIVGGENTDYFAIETILHEWILKYGRMNIVLLGDGVMSKVSQFVLNQIPEIDYRVYSRKKTEQFDQLNLIDIFSKQFEMSAQQLVINTCSREYLFRGPIDKKTLFWDYNYNYNFNEHKLSLTPKTQEYFDGLKMLELQAQHALKFWGLSPLLFK